MGRRRHQAVHFLYVLHSSTNLSTWEGNPTEEECHLKQFVDNFNPFREANITLAVTTGHPSIENRRHALANRCDLIVLATHGRTGLSHMGLGSTAEQVVHHAPCPVLTMRVHPD